MSYDKSDLINLPVRGKDRMIFPATNRKNRKSVKQKKEKKRVLGFFLKIFASFRFKIFILKY
jgi:hypothetical protein